MAATSDKDLFAVFEYSDLSDNTVLDDIIYRSLLIKKYVVEQDERESGLRKILNFGHTLAHAIESVNDMEKYYHGECVAIGMIPMCSGNVKKRLVRVLEKLNLPTVLEENSQEIIDACKHDKKAFGDNITVITVEKIGKFEMKNLSFGEFSDLVRSVALK